MEPMIEVAGARVFLGDCRDVLRTLPDNSVDSIVTDPPYELGFMGKKWDSSGIAYDVTVWAECLRVLKPGGHVLAFGGSRTWHRLAVAVEDAGFELRDSIAWIYGSGFPKSLDVSKAIDKKAGAEREVVTEKIVDIFGEHEERKEKPAFGIGSNGSAFNGHSEGAMARETLPATSEAKQWQGWGTALKPAFEPVVVGRKPLVGTVAENVLAWGVGGLNIDGSRIATDEKWQGRALDGKPLTGYEGGDGLNAQTSSSHVQGRWPANVILDEVTAGLLDEQSGNVKGASSNSNGKTAAFTTQKSLGTLPGYNDTGGASRFFYVAKASKRDRNEGLEELSDTKVGSFNGNVDEVAGRKIGAKPDQPNLPGKNHHPTVKPTQLMRYLIKLVTPEGGTVLDPFTGSGSTGKAALLDGYRFVGAELTEEYLPIIEGRLRWASEQVEGEDVTLF
jgi:DNA modification methylase